MLDFPSQLFYTVRQGDTIYQIAKKWELPIETIIASNNLIPPYTIYVGQQLAIPPGVTLYRVKPGDSIFRIAHFYGIPTSTIIEVNNLQYPFTIYPEQLLYIPPGVSYYVVQRGDTLYEIAKRFNVITTGQIRPELIQQINQIPSNTIFPGMRLTIPHVPPGDDEGVIAYTTNRTGHYDIWSYKPRNGRHKQLTKGLGDSFSVPYWSPDSQKIAFVGKHYISYILDYVTRNVAK
ncbi:LysM peptidoglycan-binding domain-containing protein [Salirhabdus salicampi]|uniref:LysM peptidoglycan-binding domain-containing protein n=1 Tax=Salirhabdus salicampi TaxID=476102 RepID=UPI0020C34962|nr:LysM peptidoglycan-binding domain-containing protein [Salirhabdus salicampi]MCP8616281.1 LysM peptidoglycan-binding domain-containing protein [Salirhabdus salicampi]